MIRSAESDDDHLQTPNCSNTGYEDDENNSGEAEEAAAEAGEEENAGDEQWSHEEEATHHVQVSEGSSQYCNDGNQLYPDLCCSPKFMFCFVLGWREEQ